MTLQAEDYYCVILNILDSDYQKLEVKLYKIA